jgi:hypothetical protein
MTHPTPSPDLSPHHTPSPNTSVNIKDILRKPWNNSWQFWFKEASKDGKHSEEESGNFLSSFSSKGYMNSLQVNREKGDDLTKDGCLQKYKRLNIKKGISIIGGIEPRTSRSVGGRSPAELMMHCCVGMKCEKDEKNGVLHVHPF